MKSFLFDVSRANNIFDIDKTYEPKFFHLFRGIDEDQNQKHYSLHLMSYYNNLRKLVDQFQIKEKSVVDIMKSCYGDVDKESVFNNSAQIINHILFFETINPGNKEKIVATIKNSKTTVDSLVEKIMDESTRSFGSCWLWLVVDENDDIDVVLTPNAYNPMCHDHFIRIIGCIDLWEHAYYLQFLSKRLDYVRAITSSLFY